MSTLVSENFDGVTAPALPSGWTFNGSWATNSTVALSAPNSLVENDLSTVDIATYNTIAPVADITVSASILTGIVDNTSNQEAFVAARFNSQTFAGSSGYLAGLLLGVSDVPHDGIQLLKRVSGSNSSLGTVIPTGSNSFAANVWYAITLQCVGSTISVMCQRSTDSKYLTSGGTWQSSTTTCISVTDSSVSAAGYVGLVEYIDGSTLTYMRVDNFLATYTVGATAFTLTGPSAGPVSAASTVFTFTPTGGVYIGTITPSMTSLSGTWSPSSLTWSGTATPLTATFTASGAGTGTANGTGSPSLTQPTNVGYTAKATTTVVYVVQDGPISGGTVGYQINNLDATVFGAHTTSGITNQGGGVYSTTATVPTDYAGVILWDNAETEFASESLVPPTVTQIRNLVIVSGS